MALVGMQLAIVLLIGRNWAYVTTYRLYLDRRIDSSDRSAAAQSFDIDVVADTLAAFMRGESLLR